MSFKIQNDNIQRFVKHQKLWGALLLSVWFFINVIVLATTRIMEFERAGEEVPAWQPFCWEISSVVMILLLIPAGIRIQDRWLSPQPLRAQLLWHAILTLPFSIIHVAGMVVIRQLCYEMMDAHYNFGDIPTEFLYEYRKDAQTYLTMAMIIFGYRLIVRRLQGEARYLDKGDSEPEHANDIKPERLLVKKLDREFLVQVSAIEWIEASGNYANLHVKDSVYPMRITMEKLEKLLPDNFIRVHRSTIVDMGQIQEVEALDAGDYQIKLRSGKTLTLSRRYREAFKNQLSLG
jgi:hypothetical protein